MTLESAVFAGGVLHFGILVAGFLVPFVLHWRTELTRLDGLTRRLVWTHGAFIFLVIVGFGVLSVTQSEALVAGSPLARGVCLFIALFWLARLAVQLFVIHPQPYLTSRFLKTGYHGLTAVFVYHVVVYTMAAISV